MTAPDEAMSAAGAVDPASIIPHRPPFLLLDEVFDLVPAASARARWSLSGDEPFFAGHFPGRPTLPGVLMLEAIAQLGAVTLLADERYTGKLPLFGGIDRARFRRQLVPPDVLEVEVVLEQLSGRGGRGRGRTLVGGKLSCEAELLFMVVDA